MPTLVWDEVGTRFYEEGVDRGVLYPPNAPGVAWSGLISVSERLVGGEPTPIYFDGVKYADSGVIGEYSGTIKAYTYPDEFLEFEGVLEVGNGLYAANQQTRTFGLTYRTRVGSDETGDAGYKIHVLYNLTALPSQKNFESLSNSASPIPFEWNVTAIPAEISGFRPTAHLIFDTRKMSTDLLSDLEDALYGDGVTAPRLPAPSTLAAFIGSWVIIRITDNLDGTWTAEGPDSLISETSPDVFQILQATATYTDANTYILSDTTY
jgi:hypothetical protein